MQTPPMLSGGLPAIGHVLEMIRDRDTLFKRGYEEHGKIFSIKMGQKTAVVLTGSDYNRFVFQESDKSLNVQDGYEFLRKALGDFIFIIPTEAYLNRRPVLQEIFGRQRMVDYVEVMNIEVQHWLDSLGEEGETNLTEDMLMLTQYVAGHAFVGENFREELSDDFWENYNTLSKALDFILPPTLPLPKFIKRDRARAKLLEVMNRVIATRRKNLDEYDDLLATLMKLPLKDGTYLEDEAIVDTFIGLLFGGHETTAGQAAWTLVELLHHPDYLSVIQQEIDEHFTYGESINGGELRNTPHIYYAIDEITRIHPSGEILVRTANEDIELDGYLIPKGAQVYLNAINSHNLPEVWSNPEQFDPYRWSPERNEGDAHSIIGFGGGMHKCTGMNFAKNEMAVIIGLLFQQFEVELLSTHIEKKFGTGGIARPSEARIRYRRKSIEEMSSAKQVELGAD